uniref:Uncharacterized protein n=1 Tax=Panagrolaimus sp. JU765 TaxID=591449 RepID=A0AC34R5A7_9BILA
MDDAGCSASGADNAVDRDYRTYFCKDDMCNQKVEDKRAYIICLKPDGSTEVCSSKMCFVKMNDTATIEAGCAKENEYSHGVGKI